MPVHDEPGLKGEEKETEEEKEKDEEMEEKEKKKIRRKKKNPKGARALVSGRELVQKYQPR